MSIPKPAYNPKTAALVIIDMQEVFRDDGIKVIPSIQSLVKTCHENDVPVFWTQHGHRNLAQFDGGALRRWWGDKMEEGMVNFGSDGWKFMKELEPYILRSETSLDTKDFIIKSKTRYDAFYKTELSTLLTSLGIETIIIAGVRTNLCCETTAKSGFDENYDVVFVKDATATETQEMHEATLLNLEYGWAKIATTADVNKWLARTGKL